MILIISPVLSSAQGNVEYHLPPTDAVLGSNDVELVWEGCTSCDIQLDSLIGFNSPITNEMGQSIQSIQIQNLDFQRKYYWRVRETGSPWAEPDSFYLFNPAELMGLELWLCADSLADNLNDPIEEWQDISPNSHLLSQANTDFQPVLIQSEFNGKRGVQFDGSDDILVAGDVLDIFNNSKTIFAIFKSNIETYALMGKGALSDIGTFTVFPANGSYRFLVREASQKNLIASIPHQTESLSLVQAEYNRDEGNMKIFINTQFGGQLGNTDQNSSFDNDINFVIGGFKESVPSFRFNGYLGQIMIFNEILSEEEINLINQYIRYIYAPPIYLGPNFTQNGFCDTVLMARGYKNVTWNDGSTADSLVVTSTGKYWVTVEDIFGNISSDTIEIGYPGNFIESFSLCAGSDSLWDTGLNPLEYSFIWNDNSVDPFINIASQGQYYTEITDGDGCVFNTDTVDVDADNYPGMASLGPDLDLCAGNSISLVTGGSETISYTWNDDSNEEELDVFTTGNYWVEATNENNCVAYDTVFVNIIGEAPTASFSFENLCFGELVEFTDLSTPPSGESIELWSWDFGDTATSSETSPQHQYDTLGSYTVSLFIETEAGCTDVFAANLNINPVPVAGFNVENLCADQLTFFTDASSIESGNIVGWSWMFGDLGSGFGSNVNHIYQESGSYDVQYVVTSDVSCADTINQTININGSPIADFITSSNCLGQPTVFNANVDDSDSGPIASFFWDFDNGFTSIFPNTTQTYFIPDQYLVSLTATSQLGCSDDTTIVITINDLPQAGFDHLPACIDEPTQFNDTSIIFLTDSISEWNWNFSNLNVSIDQNPINTFTNTGSFIVSLTVTSLAGCESTAESIINVFEDPHPDFSFDPVIGLPPLEVNFENLTEDATTYQWLFGDGGMSNDFSPQYTYSDTGIYQATLIAYNDQNCQEGITKEVLVIEPLFDLAILDLSCEIIDGRVNTSATVFNFGNHDLLNFNLKLDIGNGARITEQFNGRIRPGESQLYNFIASPDYSDEIDQPFICVTLSDPNGNNQEVTFENNAMCKALEGGSFASFPPFPNPADGIISFHYILPVEGEILIEVFDTPGRIVKSESRAGTQGVNLATLTIPELRTGNYVLKITYLDQNQTHWFNVK